MARLMTNLDNRVTMLAQRDAISSEKWAMVMTPMITENPLIRDASFRDFMIKNNIGTKTTVSMPAMYGAQL